MASIFHDDITDAKKLLEQLTQLIKMYDKMADEVKEGLEKKRAEIEKTNKVEASGIEGIKQQIDQYKKLIADGERLKKVYKENTKEVERNEKANKKRVTAMMEANAIAKKEAKTIDEMRKKVSALNMLWKNAKFDTKEQKELARQLAKTTEELKKQEAAVGITSRNVGNYKSALSGLNKMLGVVGLSAVSFQAILKTGKSVIESAQGASDKFKEAMMGAKWGTDALMKSIATADFSNLITRMREAIAAGREYYKMLDDIGDLTREYAVLESELNIQIQEQKQIMMDQTASYKERAAAGTKAIDLELDKSRQLYKLRKDEYDAELFRIKKVTGLNEERIKKFVREYRATEELRKEAQKYLDAQSALSKKQNQDQRQIVGLVGEINKLKNIINNTSQAAIDYADVLDKMNKVNDGAEGELESFAQKWVNLNNVQVEYMKATSEYSSQVSGMLNQIKNKSESAVQSQNKYWDNLKAKSQQAADKYRELSKEFIDIANLTKEEIEKIKIGDLGVGATPTDTSLPEEDRELAALGGVFAGISEMFNKQDPDELIKKDEWQESLSEVAGYVQLFGGAISQVFANIAQANQDSLNQQMTDLNNRYSYETQLLDEQLRNKQISENEYNTRKLQMEQQKNVKEEKLRKEAAKKQKQTQLTQAIINTALSVTSAATTQPFIPLGLLAVLAAIAIGAAEIAVIEGATFAKGGHQKLGEKGSILKGKRHSQGGVNLGEVGTAEAGEYMGIISRPATQKYEDILPTVFDSLNNQSFENVFTMKPVVITESKYQKKMYQEMTKTKPETRTTVTDKMIITQVGNHITRTYL